MSYARSTPRYIFDQPLSFELPERLTYWCFTDTEIPRKIALIDWQTRGKGAVNDTFFNLLIYSCLFIFHFPIAYCKKNNFQLYLMVKTYEPCLLH